MVPRAGRAFGRLLLVAGSISTALAKPDIDGCTWSTTTYVTPQTTIESRVYYVPDTLEICAPGPGEFLELSKQVATTNDDDDDDESATASPRPTGPSDDNDDDDDDDDSSTTSEKQTKDDSSKVQSTPAAVDTTKTVLLTATEPTPQPPGPNGPVTTPPSASPTGASTNNRLGPAGLVVGVAMAIAAL